MSAPYAYYNEIDPFAAAWLRELIARNVIMPGDVDERTIHEVTADDVRDYTQCHFFAGIGVWSYALRSAGWPDSRRVWTGSCPCQPFSASGKKRGFSDDRHLWPVWFPLIDECRPATIFGEQVASKDGLAWLDAVQTNVESADYAFGSADLCAAGVGAPHIRQRLYWLATLPDAYTVRSQGQWKSAPWAWSVEQFEGLVQDSLRTALPAGKCGALADVTPARVGRLRGYGNAIVAEVAKTFIKATIDTLGIPSCS